MSLIVSTSASMEKINSLQKLRKLTLSLQDSINLAPLWQQKVDINKNSSEADTEKYR